MRPAKILGLRLRDAEWKRSGSLGGGEEGGYSYIFIVNCSRTEFCPAVRTIGCVFLVIGRAELTQTAFSDKEAYIVRPTFFMYDLFAKQTTSSLHFTIFESDNHFA